MEAGRQGADDARALAARWARGDDPQPPDPVAAPSAAPRLRVVGVEHDVEARVVVVAGQPSPSELRGSLATLLVAQRSPAMHEAAERLAASAAEVDAPLGRIARAETVARERVLAAGLAGRLAVTTIVSSAAIAAVGMPAWMLAGDPAALRDELGAAGGVAGVTAIVLTTALLASGRLGRDDHGAPRPPRMLELVGACLGSAWLLVGLVAVLWRAWTLGAWLPAFAVLALHVAAVAIGAFALVVAFAPRLLGGAASHVGAGRVLATPSLRLQALGEAFDAHLARLDARGAARLDAAIADHLERLVAERVLVRDVADAVLAVPLAAVGFDASLAARLAVRPDGLVVLQPHVSRAAVGAVVDGGLHGGRLAMRIVHAVTGERSRRAAPWEARMLVDLVVAARVPVLRRRDAVAILGALLHPVALGLAAAAGIVACVLLASWAGVAARVSTVAQPTASVALLASALVLVALVDVGERVASLRSAPTTTAWAVLGAVAAASAAVVGTATTYSAYLVTVRAPWVLALAMVAVVAAAALAARVVERLQGRIHDAVHRGSACWPLSPGRVERLRRARDERIAAASHAHVDAIVARLHPALGLAVELGRLDVDVLATLPRHP